MINKNELSPDLASNVEKYYNEVINKLEWTPEYWDFMNSLGSLDKSISDYLYSILYDVPDDFYKYLNKWADREEAESHILKMVLKDKISDDAKCSINSLIDRYSVRIADLAKCWESLSKVKDNLSKEVILPPDPDSNGFRWIVSNTDVTKTKNVKEYAPTPVDKILLLSSLLNDIWIDLETGVDITTSKNNPNNVRKFPYKAFYVHDLDVTILITPWFGDAPWYQDTTFVFSGDKIPFGIWKNEFIEKYTSEECSPVSIKFYSNKIFQWKERIKKALLRDCKKLDEKIEIARSKFQDSKVRDDWFSRNTTNRNKFFIDLGNWVRVGYIGIARLFLKDIDKPLLFNDENFCSISEFIFWKNDSYLNILRNKWNFVNILRSVYWKKSVDLNKLLTSTSAYKKNFDGIKGIFLDWMLENEMFLEIKDFIKQWLADDFEINDEYLDWLKADLEKFLNLWLPTSFDWMVWLLWWNTACLESWYLQALLCSKNEWDKYFDIWEFVNSNEIFENEFISFLKSVYKAKTKDFKKLISSWLTYKENRDEIMKFLYKAFLLGKFKWRFKNTIKTRWKFLDDNYKSIFNLWMPESFDWLIARLWWNKKCLECWYLWALLEWHLQWDKYFEMWEYIKENQKNFVSFLKANWEKIKDYFSWENTYQANRKNIIEILTVWTNKDAKFIEWFTQWLPGSFKSLIHNLWWDPKISLSSNYLESLFKL